MTDGATNDAGEVPRTGATNGFWSRIIAIVSLLVCGAVGYLVLGPRPAAGQLDVSLNGLTAMLLLIGWGLVLKRRIEAHRKVMLAAFASSSAFLCSYVIYHWFKAAPKSYAGDHRGLYLAILLSHIVLAAIIVPLALFTLQRGWTMQRARHRKLAKITLPLWLYVSVTGVAIYVMLYW
jgi:putative membrane protein